MALQGAAFILFVWIFSGRGWRWLMLAPAVPVFGAVLNYAFFFAVPAYFLIEAETAQEAWIAPRAAPGTWKLLTGTDCQIGETAHGRPLHCP